MTICRSPDEVLERYAAALVAGDLGAISDLYDDDGVYFRPAIPVYARGREAVERFYRESLAQFDYEELTRLEGSITIAGDFAFLHGLFEAVGKSKRTGEVGRPQSRTTLVFRRGDDGGWRFLVQHGS